MQNPDEKQLLEEKYGGVASTAFEADRKRLSTGEPLAYVIGWVSFLGLRIYLDSHPLIPRPETEWWTEQMLSKITTIYGSNFTGTFLDVCAGSGAIGCAILKQVPDALVSFGELEPRHEATIRKNIRENGLDESRADIRIGDLFAPFAGESFDIIAANPPYVPEDRVLPASVADFEPAEALRGGGDGLAFIRRIAQDTPAHLNKGGELWMECDAGHANEALALVRAGGAKRVTLSTDPYGRPRCIVAH